MSTLELNQTTLLKNNIKYVFNLFNIPQPHSNTNINNTSHNAAKSQRSLTPSVLSENSDECMFSIHNMVSDAASSYSEESEELTNLAWLTELRNELLTWPESMKSIVADNCLNENFTNRKQENQLSIQQKKPTASERYNIFLDKVKKDIKEYDLAAEIYQKDVNEKPPFNYSHIIGMAMVENGRMTLQQICSWIESKFAFFRVRKRWNNSIRHNLSLHHCFKKIDRSKYEKGKGGYWELGIDPKKCDRKRIRNRKSNNNRNRTKGESKERQDHTNTETTKATVQPKVKDIENENIEEFVFGELTAQQNVVIQKETNLNSEILTPILSLPKQATTIDSMNSSIRLQDVFLANNGNNIDSNNCNKMSSSPNLSENSEFELSTITVSSDEKDISHVSSMNITDIERQINVFVEDIIPDQCENVVISSYHNNECIPNQSQPNVIVEQMEPYCTIATSSETESSFRPYIDGIDEVFHYIRSMDTRCDDLFDNLLDISVTDY